MLEATSQAGTIYKAPMVQVSDMKGMKSIKLSESGGWMQRALSAGNAQKLSELPDSDKRRDHYSVKSLQNSTASSENAECNGGGVSFYHGTRPSGGRVVREAPVARLN